MKRLSATLLAATMLTPALAVAQQAPPERDARIRDAMSAAPEPIAAAATIMDWPATEGGEPVLLREGSNGWTCFPDLPITEGSDPQCIDAAFLAFIDAYLRKEPPKLDRIGFGYMVAHGGAYGSNTDPYATAATDDNEWGLHPPHVMIAVPDPAMLEGLPTSMDSGGPYVMWKGTPYVHLMIPTVKP